MVLEDIEKAKSIINEKSEPYKKTIESYFARIYPISTENLRGYLKYFNFDGSHVLTTGSSCDQIFNLASWRASQIDHFDVNPFVKYYFALKKAGIEGLNRTKYIDFFCGRKNSKNNMVLDDKIYQKLSDSLDSDSKLFWDSLYNLYTPSQISDKLFFDESMNCNNYITNNIYLDRSNYSKVLKNIDNCEINFINTNIIRLPIEKEKYDYVLLSNVFDYLYNLFIIDESEFNDMLYFYNQFLNILSQILKDNGIMFFHYFWEIDRNIICNVLSEYLKNDSHISTIKFQNASGRKFNDGVMVYKKER